jgi:TRAP-type C4-dicarboxylate transport system permease small subunit
MDKLLDLRFMIGMFFIIIGLLILGYSFTNPTEAHQEINRWCGIVFSVFGALMVVLSFQKDAGDEILDPNDDLAPRD